MLRFELGLFGYYSPGRARSAHVLLALPFVCNDFVRFSDCLNVWSATLVCVCSSVGPFVPHYAIYGHICRCPETGRSVERGKRSRSGERNSRVTNGLNFAALYHVIRRFLWDVTLRRPTYMMFLKKRTLQTFAAINHAMT